MPGRDFDYNEFMRNYIKQGLPLAGFITGMLFISATRADSPHGHAHAFIEKLDAQHLRLSRRVVGLAEDLDSYFAGNEIVEVGNKSYVKLRLESFFEKGGGRDFRVRMKGKLDLPNTRQKIRLFFDNKADNASTLSAKSFQNDPRKDTSSEVGLEYLKDRKVWSYSTSLGLKPELPLNPVIKFKAERPVDVGDTWDSRFTQKIRYYHEKGWIEESAISFERPLDNDSRLRVLSELQFQDRYNSFEFAQIFSIHRRLTEKSSIQYSVGGFANSRPSWKSSNYFVMLEYRKDINKGWLFMNVAPVLEFPRWDAFKPNPSLSLSLEAVFSGP